MRRRAVHGHSTTGWKIAAPAATILWNARLEDLGLGNVGIPMTATGEAQQGSVNNSLAPARMSRRRLESLLADNTALRAGWDRRASLIYGPVQNPKTPHT